MESPEVQLASVDVDEESKTAFSTALVENSCKNPSGHFHIKMNDQLLHVPFDKFINRLGESMSKDDIKKAFTPGAEISIQWTPVYNIREQRVMTMVEFVNISSYPPVTQ